MTFVEDSIVSYLSREFDPSLEGFNFDSFLGVWSMTFAFASLFGKSGIFLVLKIIFIFSLAFFIYFMCLLVRMVESPEFFWKVLDFPQVETGCNWCILLLY